LFCALFSSHFALNCCGNAAGDEDDGEEGEGDDGVNPGTKEGVGDAKGEGGMWVLFQFTTK